MEWKSIQTEGNAYSDLGFNDERASYFQQKTYSTKQSKRRKQVVFLIGFVFTLIILILLYSKYHDAGPMVPGWYRNTTRETPHYVLPNRNTTLIQPSKLCKGPEKNLLIIVVCSSSNNFEARQSIRETWGHPSAFNFKQFSMIHNSKLTEVYLNVNYSDWKIYAKNGDNSSSTKVRDFHIQTVFLVGQTTNNETQAEIIEESQIHDDIIQESFLDTYNNLTLKTLMLVKWMTNNCADKVKYIMKSDDDMIVNVPNLIQLLIGGSIPSYHTSVKLAKRKRFFNCNSPSTSRLSRFDELLIGSKNCDANPILDRSSKHFMPRYLYDKKTYPIFLSGSGYVMTIDAAIRLYNVSMKIPLLYLEDVYLTGLCAESASIELLNHDMFDFSQYDNICELRGMITFHGIKTRRAMKDAYQSLFDNIAFTC